MNIFHENEKKKTFKFLENKNNFKKMESFYDKSPTVFQECNMLPFLDSRYIFCRRKFGHCHVLRTPNEPFFIKKPKLSGLDRKFGQINFCAFGLFSANLSAPILYSKSLVHAHVFH